MSDPTASDLPWSESEPASPWAPHHEPLGRARQRVSLERQKNALDAQLKSVHERIAVLKDLQMDDLENERVPVSFNQDGASIHLWTQLRSKANQETIALLKQHGPAWHADHLVREAVNANSLSAWIREFIPPAVKIRDDRHLRELLLDPDPKPLPPQLLQALSLTIVREVRVTGAGTNDA